MADLLSTNDAVKKYRAWLEQGGRKDPREDIELTLELGDQMRAKGDLSLEQSDPQFREQYLAAKQATDRGFAGELGAGIKRGARGLAETGLGAAALGLDAVGAHETAGALADKAREVGAGGEDSAPTVSSLGDVQDTEGAVRYGLGKVGEAVPSIGEAILTGLIGAGAGTAAEPGVGTAAGGVAGFIERNAIKNLIKKEAAGLTKSATEAEVRMALRSGENAALRNAFKAEAGDVAKKIGSGLGAGANAYALSAGQIYNDTRDPGLALGAGAIAAVPGTVLPQMVLSKFFPGTVTKEMADSAGSYFSRLLKDAAKEIPVGAGSTVFQDLVTIAADKYKKGEPAELTDADIARLKEAAIGGAAGGLIAAPLSAAPSNAADVTQIPKQPLTPEQRQAARIRALSPVAPEAPVTPRPKTRGEIVRDLTRMDPAAQDARIGVLQALSKRTPDEEAELNVLQAVVSQRPKPTVVPTQPTPAPASVASPAAVPPPAEAATPIPVPAATPLVKPPAAPPAEATAAAASPLPSAPAAPAPTSADLAARTRQVGARLSKLVTRVPSLDVSEATSALGDIAKAGVVTPDALTALEGTLTALESKSVAEVARVTAERAALASDAAKKKAELAEAKLKDSANSAAEKLQSLADKAAKKIQNQPDPDTQAAQLSTLDNESPALPAAPAEIPPAPPSAAESPATVSPVAGAEPAAPLADQLGKALGENAPSTRTAPFAFGKVTNESKPLAPGEKLDTSGALSDKGNRSKTRIAVALQAPDGRVLLRGLTPYETVTGLKKVGAKDAGYATGDAVQAMGQLKGKLKDSKVIDPKGKQQVLVADLEAAGYKPIAQIKFDAEPGSIAEDFPTLADFNKAWDNTEKVAGGDAKAIATEAQTAAALASGDAAALPKAGKKGQTLEKMQIQLVKLKQALETPNLPQSSRDAIEGQVQRLLQQIDTFTKTNQKKGGQTSLDALTVAPKIEVNGEVDPAAAAGALSEEVVPQQPEQPAAATAAVEDSAGGKIASRLIDKPDILDDLAARMKARNGDLSAKAAALTNSFITKQIAAPLGLELPAVQEHLQKAWQGAKVGARTDLEVFKQLVQKSDPLAVDAESEQAGTFRRDAGAPAPARAQDAAQFDQLVNTLRAQGHDVTLLQKEFGGAQDAWVTKDGRIFLVMDDTAAGNLTNIAALIHEAAHNEIGTLAPERQAALFRAVDNTIDSVKAGELLTAAKNANASAEEKIVETLGIKLAEEGFGSDPSLAGTVWRTVKDLYYRAANALLKSIGADPGDEFIKSWFENSLRRRLGGDYDYRFADLLSPFRETTAMKGDRYDRVAGAPTADFLDPVSGVVRQGEMLPDTVDAADWNVKFRQDDAGGDLDYTQAMARVTSAAWNEVLPIIEELKKTLGKDFTDSQFWSRFARGDAPKAILDRMESRAPGSSQTKLGDAVMTPAMGDKARYQAFTIANALAGRARRKAAERIETADAKGVQLINDAKRLNKLEREFRDAAAVNAHFNESLRDSIKEFALDLDRGPDTAFAAGKLMGAIRAVEGLTDDQAIPEEYQRVFKQILDTDGTTSLFDKLESIAKLDLPLSRLTVGEIIDAVKLNAPKDANLRALAANRPLLVALASLARNSTREMDLMQLRVLKDTTQFLAIKSQLEEIRTASDERLDQLAKDIKTGQANQGLADRLRGEFLQARREFRSTQRVIQRAEESASLNSQVAVRMQAKADELSRDVGAFSSWTPHDGATYTAMQLRDDGKWVSTNRTLRMVGNDVGEQREQIRSDLAQNNLWLEAHSKDAGSRIYEEVKRQTYELGVAAIGDKEYRAAHRFLLDKFLQPLGQKFASTGRASGQAIQQMLNRWQFITKTHSDEVEVRARKWTKALEEARTAAGYKYNRDFLREIYDPVVYAIESEPGRDEIGALRAAARVAQRRIPEANKVADNFHEKLGNLMRATKDISEKLNAIAEQQGVYVADKRVKDPLTGKGNLQRHAIKYGWLTSTRRLRPEVIRTLVHDMQATGWAKDMFAGIAEKEMHDGDWQELAAKHFTPNVTRTFVEPFVYKPGKEVFFGAEDRNGEPAHVSQLMAQEAWEQAGGDVLAFADNLFDRTNTADNRDALPAFRKAIFNRFGDLYEMESKLAAKVERIKDPENPSGAKSHRIMDSRTNDLIPPEHFSYDAFDPTSARIALGEVGFHAAFGRDGAALDQAKLDLKTDLDKDARIYNSLTGPAKEKRRQAEAMGLDFKKLERSAKDFDNINQWMNQVVSYFGGTNPSGAVGDAKTALELLQLNTQLVLNQPKSGLWNVLSLADFPIAFRGLNKSSLQATAFAGRELGKNLFGSLLEAAGINVLHASEYAKEIGQVLEHRQTERLPWGTFMADIGKGGSFEDSLGNRTTQAIRGVQQAMRKGFKAGGKEGDFAGNNSLWAPFNYINQTVASSIATANVQTFELMVKKAVKYYADHPEAANDPAFKFTAEKLGMKGKLGFFSDEGAFDYYRNAALEYRLGSLEELAKGAADRISKGDRILTRDQVLGLALMANNELSLESSINSRPSQLFNNPVLRFGGMMMGWPLAKMNQVHQSLKTAEGRLEARAVLKGLGVLAAWSLPVGLAYSMLMDRYDDSILNKKSNLRGIDPIAGIPVIGPAAALFAGDRSFKDNALGMMERTAKAGNVWGLGGDFLNSLTNFVDPTSGQRDFSLDSRVLAFSQYANIRDTIRNLIQQDGAVTYSSIIRPMLASLGGNGVLQYQQILNNALGLSNAESAVTNRINVNAYLRAAGREAGIELKSSGGRTSPTPTSVWVREMQLAALSNDRLGFLEAYRNAVDAARKDDEADPEAKILASWKARDPLKSVFASSNLTDTEQGKLNAALGDDGRRTVNEAEDLYARYTDLIAPGPMQTMFKRQAAAQKRAMTPPTAIQIRRQIALQAMGY